MLALRVIQAAFGDCLLLEYPAVDRIHYFLIDGGPEGVYPGHLRPVLQTICEQGGKLDLLVLTHVDNDHILGLLELMTELRAAQAASQPGFIAVDGLWHNSFSQITGDPVNAGVFESTIINFAALSLAGPTPDPDEPPFGPFTGIDEGHQLHVDDVLLAIPRNAGFDDGLVCIGNCPQPLSFGDLKLWLLGPTHKNLDRLKADWEEWLAKQAEPPAPFAAPEAEKAPSADRSVNNLSSIMLLAEADDRRILLTGDGRGDDAVKALEAAGLLAKKGQMHVDVMKVPHHGSARNASRKFFRRVTADIYVLSADGRDDNPDYLTLRWIVETAKEQNRPVELFATNDTDSLQELRRKYDPEKYGYRLSFLPAGAHSQLL